MQLGQGAGDEISGYLSVVGCPGYPSPVVGAGSLQRGCAHGWDSPSATRPVSGWRREAGLGLHGEHRPPVAAAGRLCPAGARHPLSAPTPGGDAGCPPPAPTMGGDAGYPHQEGMLGAHSKHPHREGMLGTHGEHPHQAGMLGAHGKHPHWAGMLGAHTGKGFRAPMMDRDAGCPHRASELWGSPARRAMPGVAAWGGGNAGSPGSAGQGDSPFVPSPSAMLSLCQHP